MIPPAEVEEQLRRVIREGLKALGVSAPDGEILLEPPRQGVHGDLASSVALQLSSRVKRPPMELAQSLCGQIERLLKESDLGRCVERVEAKAPGFINLTFSPAFLYTVLQQALKEGAGYGRSACGARRRALVEFVSANPTGPLSVAHGRQAAVGDALANILDFAGYRVRREYYLNDEGTQIDLLGQSILARARASAGLPEEFPENGYKGAYVSALAEELLKRRGRRALEGSRAIETARRFGVEELTRTIRKELDRFGVRFDRWFPQSGLRRFGYLDRTLAILRRRGTLYLSEGAWWLKSTAFGDDKDRVVIRSDGRMTYIASDIAYHRRKFQRGYRLLVNLWGPDHHGYVPRLKASVQALGFPAEDLRILIVQLCTLKRGAETLPMSTREGIFVTLTQVVEEVGKDAARFFFLLRKSGAHLEFDLELAKRHSLENPVYYIQYAHARVCNIFENARSQGLAWRPGSGDPQRLRAPEELTLLRLLRGFPGAVLSCARSLEPFGVATYLQELAEALHRFYDVHRVISSDASLSAARLDLVAGVQTVLANGLRLLGVGAPTRM